MQPNVSNTPICLQISEMSGLQRSSLAVYHFFGLHSLLVSWGIDEGGLEYLPASCLQVHICGWKGSCLWFRCRWTQLRAQIQEAFGSVSIIWEGYGTMLLSEIWIICLKFCLFHILIPTWRAFFLLLTVLICIFIAVAEGKSQNVTWHTNKPESLAEHRRHLSVRQSSLHHFFFFSALIWFCTKYICLFFFFFLERFGHRAASLQWARRNCQRT